MPRASAIDPPVPATRDPLTGLFARGRINRAQYLAGEEFLRQAEIAEGTGRPQDGWRRPTQN